jgi:hypothetical protein
MRQENLVYSIKVLKYLRSGDVTNAIIFCENLVDSSVVSLAGQVTECSKYYPYSTNDLALENDFAMNAIEHAKKYRDKFPYKSGDIYNTDERVASAWLHNWEGRRVAVPIFLCKIIRKFGSAARQPSPN